MANIRISVEASPVVSADISIVEPIADIDYIEVVVEPSYIARAIMFARVLLSYFRVDGIIVVDALSKLFQKVLSDGVGVSDLIDSKVVKKSVVDSVGIVETIFFAQLRFLSDKAGIADSISRGVQKALTDLTSISETVSKVVQKAVGDSASISESISIVNRKPLILSDTVVTSETIFLNENIFDDTFDQTFN